MHHELPLPLVQSPLSSLHEAWCCTQKVQARSMAIWSGFAKSRFVSPHVKPSGICLGVNNYTFLHFDIKGIAKMWQNQKQWIHGEELSRAYPNATNSWIHVALYEEGKTTNLPPRKPERWVTFVNIANSFRSLDPSTWLEQLCIVLLSVHFLSEIIWKR